MRVWDSLSIRLRMDRRGMVYASGPAAPVLGAELLATYTASSTYTGGEAYTGLAGNGLRDGNDLTTTHATENEVAAYIKADLGSVKAIGFISLTPISLAHPDGWGAAYVNNRALQYSIDNLAWTSLLDPISGILDGQANVIATGGINARYIRVFVTSAGDYVGLGDFRIYAP